MNKYYVAPIKRLANGDPYYVSEGSFILAKNSAQARKQMMSDFLEDVAPSARARRSVGK